ncbi:MAG: PorT family protein [Saprospiraceae bacterium]|nr:PorT family protein [Saprospiraceae bacterium]
MKKLCISTTLALLLCLLFHETAVAQQRFKAGLIFGLNASQLNGDDSAGYNKLGLNGGLRGTAMLKDKMDLVFEMLYSQRGSYERFINGDMKISLSYIEVPIMLAYKDWYQEEGNYYKVQAVGGFSYSRLLEASAYGSLHDAEVVNFNDNDFALTLGFDLLFTKHFGLGARWTRSLNRLYDNRKHVDELNSMLGYFLTFRGMYMF